MGPFVDQSFAVPELRLRLREKLFRIADFPSARALWICRDILPTPCRNVDEVIMI